MCLDHEIGESIVATVDGRPLMATRIGRSRRHVAVEIVDLLGGSPPMAPTSRSPTIERSRRGGAMTDKTACSRRRRGRRGRRSARDARRGDRHAGFIDRRDRRRARCEGVPRRPPVPAAPDLGGADEPITPVVLDELVDHADAAVSMRDMRHARRHRCRGDRRVRPGPSRAPRSAVAATGFAGRVVEGPGPARGDPREQHPGRLRRGRHGGGSFRGPRPRDRRSVGASETSASGPNHARRGGRAPVGR